MELEMLTLAARKRTRDEISSFRTDEILLSRPALTLVEIFDTTLVLSIERSFDSLVGEE